MKKVCFIITCLLLTGTIHAQKMITRTGNITFLSETPVEKITAENNQVASILVLDKKKVAFNVLLKSFKFEKALMQEHFNEKYVHSDTYPAAKFKGNLPTTIRLDKPDIHKDIEIEGTMIFHGITKTIKIQADIEVRDDQSVSFTSKFGLKLEDYKVEVPSLIKEKISKIVQVTVNTNYKI